MRDLLKEAQAMIERFRDSFLSGIKRLNWFARVFSERLRLEMAIVKLLYRSNEMGAKKDELLRTIGGRIYELKGVPEKNFMRDRVVMGAIEEIEKLEKEINEVTRKVSDLGGAGG